MPTPCSPRADIPIEPQQPRQGLGQLPPHAEARSVGPHLLQTPSISNPPSLLAFRPAPPPHPQAFPDTPPPPRQGPWTAGKGLERRILWGGSPREGPPGMPYGEGLRAGRGGRVWGFPEGWGRLPGLLGQQQRACRRMEAPEGPLWFQEDPRGLACRRSCDTLHPSPPSPADLVLREPTPLGQPSG